MYNHDALTGLYNRLGFNHKYNQVKELPENIGKPVTVIMSDLDGLKYINDTFGHAEGDRAISTLANALMNACPENALSARFGGDELFSVILGDCDPESIIKKIDEELNTFNEHSGLGYTVKTSTGAYTTVFDDSFDVPKAIRFADQEMYQVKNQRKKARTEH